MRSVEGGEGEGPQNDGRDEQRRTASEEGIILS